MSVGVHIRHLRRAVTGVVVALSVAVVPAAPAAGQDATTGQDGGTGPAVVSETTPSSAPDTSPATPAPTTSPPSTSPPTTAAPTTTVVTAPPAGPALEEEPAVEEEEQEPVVETTVAEEEPEETTTTTVARSTTTQRSASVTTRPAPSTTASTSTTTEGPVGRTSETTGDDESQGVVRLVIGLLILVAALIAVLTWRYWRYTDPRRGYAPSRARLAGAHEIPEAVTAPVAGSMAAGQPEPVPAEPTVPIPVGVAPGTGVGATRQLGDDGPVPGPRSVFDGMELHGAGRTLLPDEIDPTDPGPGARGRARQPEPVVGASELGGERRSPPGSDGGR